MIQTDSIIRMLEIFFNKDVESINESEVNQINTISIEKISYDGSFLNVNYDDLLLFKNLEELNIYNCMIDQRCIEILAQLEKLNKLCVYSCDFVDGTFDIFSKKYQKLYLVDCLGVMHSKIEDVDEVLLKNTEIMEAKNIQILKTDNLKNVKLKNINNLVIQDYMFDKSLVNNEEIKTISVIDDRNEIIKEYTK